MTNRYFPPKRTLTYIHTKTDAIAMSDDEEVFGRCPRTRCPSDPRLPNGTPRESFRKAQHSMHESSNSIKVGNVDDSAFSRPARFPRTVVRPQGSERSSRTMRSISRTSSCAGRKRRLALIGLPAYRIFWLTLVDGSVAAAAANRTGNVRGHHFDVHTPVSLVSQGRRHAFGAGGLGR